MTLRSDSDIVLAYGAIQPKREDTDVFDPNLAGRDKMAVVVISNCYMSLGWIISENCRSISLWMYSVDVAGHAEDVLIIFQGISFTCHLRTAYARTM